MSHLRPRPPAIRVKAGAVRRMGLSLREYRFPWTSPMIKLVFRLFVAAVLAVPLSAAARPGDDGEGEGTGSPI